MKKFYFCIGLLSLTILSTELFWTRIFSAEFFYTFAFLILSLAILGLGMGALLFKIFTKLNKPSLLPVYLSLAGLMILISVPLVFGLDLDFSKVISEPYNIFKLACAILLLGSGYFFGGIAIAQILKTNSDEIPKLYMADFIGASIGVITFIIIMNSFGAEITLLYCSLPALIAAFIFAKGWIKILPLSIFISAVIFYSLMGKFPEQKREERGKVVYTHWDAMAKIKILAYDSMYKGINIDNVANTPVFRFDGNWNKPDSEKIEFDINVKNLIRRFDKCCFLSLGSGGGGEVLQALGYNASEVHAVEVIPHINYLIKEGFLKDFTGNIYNDPRVKVATEDARTYIRRYKNKFDIIHSWSSNTWAAFASGAFALAENYIFTTEAFKDYWNALSEKGFLVMEHQFYAPRLVAEVMDALNSMKIPDPKSHLAVYNLPNMRRKLLLVSKAPLDTGIINNAFGSLTPERKSLIHLLYPAMESNKNNIYNSIVLNGWKSVADTVKMDISPCTDDRPFIAQVGLLKNVDFSKLNKIPDYEFTGFPISRIILYIILIICIICIIPLNLLPYLKKGEKLRFIPWSYFFAIGVAYMMIEVIIIQKYTLFIGSSIYSLALVLTALLLSSGLGSRYSSRFGYKTIFSVIAIWLLADIFIFKYFFYFFAGWSLIPRMVLSGIILAPAGFFMGMPFPKLASKYPAFVDWAFAVNGSASVIGSVVIMLIALSFGYSVSLLTGLLVYLSAYLLFYIDESILNK
jgi:predicted membrane-bound spermidine synthase